MYMYQLCLHVEYKRKRKGQSLLRAVFSRTSGQQHSPLCPGLIPFDTVIGMHQVLTWVHVLPRPLFTELWGADKGRLCPTDIPITSKVYVHVRAFKLFELQCHVIDLFSFALKKQCSVSLWSNTETRQQTCQGTSPYCAGTIYTHNLAWASSKNNNISHVLYPWNSDQETNLRGQFP